MMLKTFLAWFGLVLLAPLSSLSAAEKQPPRIAILCSEKSGWADLLMARLSTNSAISLIERDDLEKALDEIELKELLGDRKKRSRFGEIAGADFLVLLSITDNRARLIVCDTKLGVTLQDLSIGISDQSQKEALEILANTILHTIQYFAHGVKQIVAVPGFVCRDLTFDFNYLQSDYAEVLRSAYRQIPGLAMVAIEEANAIAMERDVAGLAQEGRLASVFVEGEYRTTRDLKSGGVSVEITLRARDSAKILLERKLPSVPTSQAGRELMAVFAKDLAALVQSGETKIDEQSQYRMLIERADEFALIGDFLRSTELREAALLLKPDNDEQRIKLTREYSRHNLSYNMAGSWPGGTKLDDSNPLWVAAFNRAVSDWKRSLQHCEHLVNPTNKKWFPRHDPPANAFLSIDGILWVAGSMDDFCSVRLNEETGLFDGVRERERWHAGNGTSGSLCRDGDWLYYACYKWRRIHLKTGAEELVVDDYRALPHHRSGGDWRLEISAHYGLVAFNHGELYRVEVTP